MARYDVCTMLRNALEISEALKGRGLGLNDSQRRALDLMVDALEGRRLPLGAVQGPPGTGKTTVVEGYALDHLSDKIHQMDGVLLYIAPTNHLAAQAFERVAGALLARGYTLRDVLILSRVYGFKITYSRSSCRWLEERGLRVPEDSLRELIHGTIDPSLVKIVFATEYQRVTGRMEAPPDHIYLVVDEAGKSPFYRSFISVADQIMRKPGSYPSSLVALGDPEQAITIPEAVKTGRIPLLMDKIRGVLEREAAQDSYVMLDITYRLPSPSEQPISNGFYNGLLSAYEPAWARMHELAQAAQDSWRRVRSLVNSVDAIDSTLQELMDAVETALTTMTPIILVETESFKPEGKIRTYDSRRAGIAVKLSLVLQALYTVSNQQGSGRPFLVVTAPYSDMTNNISFNFHLRYGGRMQPPRTATVQSVIGGEADIVVAVLGKEYTGSQRWSPYHDYHETMYFNEPEVLNVQLSRHYTLLAIIGSITRLAKTASSFRDRRIRKLAETSRTLIQMRDSGQITVARPGL